MATAAKAKLSTSNHRSCAYSVPTVSTAALRNYSEHGAAVGEAMPVRQAVQRPSSRHVGPSETSRMLVNRGNKVLEEWQRPLPEQCVALLWPVQADSTLSFLLPTHDFSRGPHPTRSPRVSYVCRRRAATTVVRLRCAMHAQGLGGAALRRACARAEPSHRQQAEFVIALAVAPCLKL